jgi:aminomethyltransferase
VRALAGDWFVLDALGPAAAVGLEMGLPHDLVDLPVGGSVATQLHGWPVRIVRHRGLSDEGFYILAAQSVAQRLWDALTGSLFTPIGYDAFESLRVEAGQPMPYAEVGPPDPHYSVWVRVNAPQRRVLRSGYALTNASGAVIGQITSGTVSPVSRQTHALGWLDATVDTQKAPTFVEVRGQLEEVHVTACPLASG